MVPEIRKLEKFETWYSHFNVSLESTYLRYTQRVSLEKPLAWDARICQHYSPDNIMSHHS